MLVTLALIHTLGWFLVGFAFVIFLVEAFSAIPVNIVRAYHKKKAIKRSQKLAEFEAQDLYMNKFKKFNKAIKKPLRAFNFIVTDLQILYYLLFLGFAFAGVIYHPFLFVFHLTLIIVR